MIRQQNIQSLQNKQSSASRLEWTIGEQDLVETDSPVHLWTPDCSGVTRPAYVGMSKKHLAPKPKCTRLNIPS